MRLHAAFVPPTDVLQHVLDRAQSISLAPTPRSELPKPGALGRLLRREKAAGPSPVPALTVVPSGEAFVRLGRFGNVTPPDAQSLVRALDEAARSWPVPAVHVVGLVVDTSVPRPVITAQLGGDIDVLREIFASFIDVAKRQSFFLDRRSFRPEFTVATVDLSDDPTLRERIVFEAQDHSGPDWQVSCISMMSASVNPSEQSFEEIARVTIGGEADAGDDQRG